MVLVAIFLLNLIQLLHFRTKRIMSSVRMQHFVTRLKSKNFETRKRAARDLNLYVIIIIFDYAILCWKILILF